MWDICLKIKKIKSTKMALKHTEMTVLIYTILNFIILGFRFPIKGVFRGFNGGRGKIKALPEKGIYAYLWSQFSSTLSKCHKFYISKDYKGSQGWGFQVGFRGLNGVSRGEIYDFARFGYIYIFVKHILAQHYQYFSFL